MVMHFMLHTENIIAVIGKKEEYKKLDRKDQGLVEVKLLAEVKLLTRMKLLASTDNTSNITLHR